MSATATALQQHFRAARDAGAPKHVQGRAWCAWFRQACAEGNPPDALRRDAGTPAERFDACVVEGLDGCLVWDGPMLDGKPVIPGVHLRARQFALRRRGVQIPSHRRVVPSCGNERCVAFDHLVIEEHHWRRSETDEQMLGRVQVVALQIGHTPSSTEWDRDGHTPTAGAFRLRFGLWSEVVRKAGLPPVQAATMTRCRNGLHDWIPANIREMSPGKFVCVPCRQARSERYEAQRRLRKRANG